MRILLCGLWLLAACGPDAAAPDSPPAAAAGPVLPVLTARPFKDGRPRVDGSMTEPAWASVRAKVVQVRIGDVTTDVTLKAGYDAAAKRFYLLAVWPDTARDLNYYWRYKAFETWEVFEGEDAFSVCWSPGSMLDAFRVDGCALYCHDDRHVRDGPASGYVDFWKWGAQTTSFFGQARDMWLPFGTQQRLRGDRHIADSDNILNRSEEYKGPRWVPKHPNVRRMRFLEPSDAQPLPRARLKKLDTQTNIGWEVSRFIMRRMEGSRGDVEARGRYVSNAWVLEMARDFVTGNPDDQPLGDPLVPYYFSIAIHDPSRPGPSGPSRGEGHAISGPIELRFVAAR